jgi:NADPH:quinone reductase-like Zn-dependent oxidoreductase
MLAHVTDPFVAGGLDLREVPNPEAADHEVVIEVRAYSINRGELDLLAQRTQHWRPGQDVAGTVVRAASDGSGPPAGTRVVGIADQAGWADQVCVSSQRVAALPDDVTFEQAASLPVAGLTALRALRTGPALLGRRVLVTGASGGVGEFAVQLAVSSGAEVIALVSGEHRIPAVRALGAHRVVTKVDESVGRLDLVLEGVGGQVLVDAVHHLAPGATLTTYGIASGSPRSKLAFFDFASAPLARIIGFFLYATGVDTFGTDLAMLADFVQRGTVVPQLGLVKDWSDTRGALDALRQRTVAGKVVLTRH